MVEQLGHETQIHIQIPAIRQNLVYRQNDVVLVEEGATFAIGLPPERCHLFREDGTACRRLHKEPGVRLPIKKKHEPHSALQPVHNDGRSVQRKAMISGDRMMITLRKLPLAVAVAAGVMSAQALAVDFHGYARSGIGWTGSGGEQQCSSNRCSK